MTSKKMSEHTNKLDPSKFKLWGDGTSVQSDGSTAREPFTIDNKDILFIVTKQAIYFSCNCEISAELLAALQKEYAFETEDGNGDGNNG